MELDRTLQKQLLEFLREAYPNAVLAGKMPEGDAREIAANLHYLFEHGLVKVVVEWEPHRLSSTLKTASITAAGLDFLAGDGGLGAILNTVTVKFDQEDLRQLIMCKIDESPLNPEEKTPVLNALKTLPADGLKALVTKLIDLGLDHAPNAVQILGKHFDQFFRT